MEPPVLFFAKFKWRGEGEERGKWRTRFGKQILAVDAFGA